MFEIFLNVTSQVEVEQSKAKAVYIAAVKMAPKHTKSPSSQTAASGREAGQPRRSPIVIKKRYGFVHPEV